MTIDVSLIPQNRVENLISKLSEIENNIGNIGTDITNNVVHRIGDETISGEKTFINNITAPNQIDYTNITNCITEIPQDIKLELNNGTLTLKAGSKVYAPNGAGVFDEVVISNDVTVGIPYTNGPIFIYYSNNSLQQANYSAQCSGASNTIVVGYWYDTTNNFIKRINNSEVSYYGGISLPIAIVSASNGSWTTIDQVFNGFGYIGSTVFALPGVKGRIPNGRNADGSLKSIEFTLDKVLTETFPNLDVPVYVTLKTNSLDYWQVAVTPIAYSEIENLFINGNNIKSSELILGISYLSSGKITSFNTKNAFHALDYNDKSTISGWSMPSSRYIDLTLGASGSTYTAPVNGWFTFSIGSGLTYLDAYINGALGTTATNPNNVFIRRFVPAFRGDVLTIYYTGTPNTALFRFFYTEGEN